MFFFRPDKTLQRLVYKMVPGLYSNEIQRRRQFYLNTEIESSTDTDVSCDQALALQDQQKSGNIYYSPEDSISLSLEYYIRYFKIFFFVYSSLIIYLNC